MNVLIIYAHPNSKSLNHAVLEQVKLGLKDSRHSFEVIDLYAEHFNPVLVHNEQIKRSDLVNDPEMAHYRELVKNAAHLLFIYPVWWYGMPAILKGFIDRVFVSGFAYQTTGGAGKGLFADKSATVMYTIDSPSFFVKLFRRNIEWRVVKDAILKYCGVRHVKRVMMAGVRSSTPEHREKWLELAYRQACSL